MKSFSRIFLSNLFEKIKQLYVLLSLADCYYVTTNFDLWMSKGAYDIYALVIKFLGFDWQPKHIAIGLFEASDTSKHALPKDLIKLLCKYDSRKKIIICV